MSLLYIQGVMFQTYPILGGAPQATTFVPVANEDTTFFSRSRGNYADYFSKSRGRIYYAKERE